MDYEYLLGLVVQQLGPGATVVASVLGMLVVVGTALVAVTPSTKDDEWLAKVQAHAVVGKLYLALTAFSPVQKKK